MFDHQSATATTATATPNRRRRIATGIGLALGLGLSTIAVGSASAEKPIRHTFSYSFEDENPCTGEAHVISFDIEEFFVDHGDDTGVVHFKRSGSTSDGYTTSGVKALRRNRAGVQFGNFNDVWSKAKVRSSRPGVPIATTT